MGRPPKREKNRLKLKRVSYRLPQELVETLARAAPQKNLNLSEYVELALKDRFKKTEVNNTGIFCSSHIFWFYFLNFW